MPAAPTTGEAATPAESEALVDTAAADKAKMAADDDDKEVEDDVGYFRLTKIQLPSFSFQAKEFAPNVITYLMYLTTPLHITMILIGYVHKDNCPADVRVPRYLFFGGIAGLMTVLLRIVLAFFLKSVIKENKRKGIDQFDPASHPGLSMVRVVMYIFVIFVILWNVNATHIFLIDPDLVNKESVDYCHKTAYTLAYVLVILFVAVAGVSLTVWITAIVAGICNPDFLVRYGYFKSIDDVKFGRKPSKKKNKIIRDVAGDSGSSLASSRDPEASMANSRHIRDLNERSKQLRILKELDQQVKANAEKEKEAAPPAEEHHIVRFANEGQQ